MKFRKLREQVCEVNREIGRTGLAMQTWGNASGCDRGAGVVAIKPSGIDYGDLTPEKIALLDIRSGRVIEGRLRPSSDAPTHLHLYRAFRSVGGIIHTHSHYASVWAQACMDLPCFGTTHADSFYGAVPVTRMMRKSEVAKDYEANTGKVIVERFITGKIDPVSIPAVLVAGHGPFVWGGDPRKALENALALEEIARMALHSSRLRPGLKPVPRYLLDKHFLRKHGSCAYYGQGIREQTNS